MSLGDTWVDASFALPRDEHMPVEVRLITGHTEKRKSVEGDCQLPIPICIALYHSGMGAKAIAKRLKRDPRRTAPSITRHLKSVNVFDSKRPSPFHTGAMTPKGARTDFTYKKASLREVALFGIMERAHDAAWTRANKPHDALPCGDTRRKVKAQGERIMRTPHLRIKFYLRKRLKNLLKGIRRPCRTAELAGCTYQHLKRHIEKQFAPGMTWANHGKVWHIDHITACARFDLTKREDVLRCFHYTNLRPLWARDNIAKGDKEVRRTLTLPPVIEGQGQFVLHEAHG